MVRLDLPYLWAAKGQRRSYWFYRRGGRLVPIAAPDSSRLSPGDVGFLEAYGRIHASFETSTPDAPAPGSFSHLINTFKAAPEFLQLATRTRSDYGRYLDIIKAKWGRLSVATMPREAVLKLRDDYQATPRTANYIVAVLRLLLSFAEDRPRAFGLPRNWQNPARRPRMLRTGDGHRPWEESEIAAFRRCWRPGTVERLAFELALNTGQRGGDLIAMTRRDYWSGQISVLQHKTKARLSVPVAAELRAVLDTWIETHKHVVLLTTKKGRPFKVDHFRHVMRASYRAAGLPADCTTHGLRYTAAVVLNELGCDWETVGAVTGHETVAMVRHYLRKRRASRVAIARLDQARLKTATDRTENRRDSDDAND